MAFSNSQVPTTLGLSSESAEQAPVQAGTPADDRPQHVPSFPDSTDVNAKVVITSQEKCPGPQDHLSHVHSSPDCTDENGEVVITTTDSTDKDHGKKEIPGSGDQPHHLIASSNGMDEGEETVITAIRATDVALGLRRLPAGFSVVVHHNGSEWTTENKPSLVHDDIIEWGDLIPIPSDLVATIRLEVYASCEFRPILGAGELLRELTTTVEQLLDRSAKGVPFSFLPKDGDLVSPCSSIFVTVKRQKRENNRSPAPSAPSAYRSTSESFGELERETNEGHSALSRYRRHEEKGDLWRANEHFERALDTCPVDHLCRAAAECNLAMAQLVQYQVEDTDATLEAALRLYSSALAARPVGHPDRPSTLIHLATVHFTQFQKRGDDVHEAQAEVLLHEAMELCSTETHEGRVATFMCQLHTGCRVQPTQLENQSSVDKDSISSLKGKDPQTLSVQLLERFRRLGDQASLEQAIQILEELVRSTSIGDDQHHAALGTLGTALLYRFDCLGRLDDLEGATSKLRTAVDLIPYGHPDKPKRLNNLGILFRKRFQRFGQLSDLEDAISTLRDTVNLTPHDHPLKPSVLTNLGNSLITRFERLGRLNDLEDAISRQRTAVSLIPDNNPDKPTSLDSLGISFITRFKCFGELSDLEDAILKHKDAVGLAPDGHPNKYIYLHNLGTSFTTRFERLGKLHDLEDGISTFRDALAAIPSDHPAKPTCLNSLGLSLRIRFDNLGQLSDLEDSILMLRNAIDLTPHGHPDKPGRLSNLGISLRARFNQLGKLSDLEDATSVLRDAVEFTPHNHPSKPACLNNLGLSLRTCFERLGRQHDLMDAISALQTAVDLTPRDHSDRPSRLDNLGICFKIRFTHLGEIGDLENAILKLRDAVDLTPCGHSDIPGRLNNLGISLNARFGHLGELNDLKDAILMLRQAVDLTPHGHHDMASRLYNLGTSLRTRFQRLGELGDLEDSISALRNAVDLTSSGHPDRPHHLNNLGTSLIIRLHHLTDLSDLEEAILKFREAVDLIPCGHPSRPSHLNDLAGSLRIRYMLLNNLTDIEDATSMHRDAVDLTPPGHIHLPYHLGNLGISFTTRFDGLGQLNDLENAICVLRDAVNCTPRGHPERPSRLHNLGQSLRTRFNHVGQLSDLENAISMLRDAAELTPHGHPLKTRYLNGIGDYLTTRSEYLGEPSNLEQAISLYSHVASTPIGSINDRFHASQNWISCARRIQHRSLLHAYSVAISLLPRLAWIGLSLSHRYIELTGGIDIVREAAAAALDAGFPETAVEWLEQGRSIVWGELFQLRSSYEELSSTHPSHARRLQELSAALDQASAAHEKSLSVQSDLTGGIMYYARESSHEEADRHRALAIERDKLLQEIRGLPGFEKFLLQRPFSELRASAHSGPIVILNAADSRCDALIILANMDNVVHVPLPRFTGKRSVNLRNILQDFIPRAREGNIAPLEGINWESILFPLWEGVVKPVLNALAFSAPGDLLRIFWCPTGPFTFLPIHAAGLYGDRYSKPGHKVSDFVVSSYVPTLAILAPPLDPAAVPSKDLRLLAVRQPPSDGHVQLPGVVVELRYIKDLIRDSSSSCITLLESSEGTVEEVLELMKEADWVHFSCHGIQDGVESGLCLADKRRLRLRDIIALSRPRGGLAFLSACQTATGDEGLSDESVHIAAGMLFAGYQGVVGTMWSISDRLAPVIARDVYAQLIRNGTRPDGQEAALALHEAIGRLRDRGALFDEWVPFMHVGL